VPSVAAGLGGFFAVGVSFAASELGVFVFSGEPLAPLGFGGLGASGAFPAALGLGGLLALRSSLPLLESFARVSGSRFCGALHKVQVSTNARFS
jgi:hypothetical protein